jgi:CRP-like cAMP-binding protein
MRKLSTREKAVLEALDAEIEDLERKLAKFQPYIDELARLRKARAVMLDEKSLTGRPRGNAGGGAQMEQIIVYLRENGSATTNELADHLGTTVGSVRAHLNRFKDERYRTNGDGKWHLIGTEGDDAEEEDDGDED